MADISATSWSEVDASNNQAPPLGWPVATMLPNQVEPTAQAGMGATKRAWDRINGTVTTAGSSGAYTYTPVNTSYPVAYVQGEVYRAKLHQNSAGSDTLNINSLGALNLYKFTAGKEARVAAGDLLTGQIVEFVYDAALNSGAGGFLIIAPPSAVTLRNYIAGLTLSNSAGSPNTIIDVAAGVATDSTSIVTIFAPNGLHPDISVSGVGGLDSGAVAANTWYAVILINGTSGTSTLFTKQTAGSAISPTMPAGYTYYRYLGSVLTDSSSHIKAFKQVGNVFYWGAVINDVNTGTISSGLITLSVPVGSIKTRPLIRVYFDNGSSTNIYITISSPDEASTGSTGTQDFDLYTKNSSFLETTSQPFVTTDNNGRVRLQSNFSGSASTTLAIFTRGWVDPHVASIF